MPVAFLVLVLFFFFGIFCKIQKKPIASLDSFSELRKAAARYAAMADDPKQPNNLQ
jgi:hypothetical protein